MNIRIKLPDQRNWSQDDADLIFDLACAEARESFWAYRQFINPDMKLGWFQRELAIALQRFYDDMVSGKAPIIILQTPPQHGKSLSVIDFISWVAGKNPDLATIYASFSDRLGIRANLRLQRTYDNQLYNDIFPETCISNSNSQNKDDKGYLRNHDIIEYIGRNGYFRNTTVNGPVTGEGLDLGVVDDPLKGRAEANSPTIRDKVWGWLLDDFYTRFSENAGLLLIMTRWHLDDPAGRLIEEFPNIKVLRYPAIAEQDERYRKKGEPLFPELKSLEFLNKRRSLLTQSGWQSIYQQSPIISGGGMFPVEKFIPVPIPPPLENIKKSVRYWDKAGTEGGGKNTAGVLMHEMIMPFYGATYVVSSVISGQWGAMRREQFILQTAQEDSVRYNNLKIYVEREPGSGGKESAENTIRNLRGYSIFEDRVTGDKETRAEPYAAQVEGGNVGLVVDDWNKPFKDEHEVFPNGPFKDRVDAAAGAFNKIHLVKSESSGSSVRGLLL